MITKRHLVLFFLLAILTTRIQGQVTFPLGVSKDKRYLVDQNDKPFPILGRTAWFIVSQPEEGYQKFIENSLAHGYNAIEFAAITHWPMGNHAPYNGVGEIPFSSRLNGEPWDGVLEYKEMGEMPDLLTPNEKYWSHVDRLLAYCEDNGMVAFMFPAYLGYHGEEQGWMKELVANGPKRSEAYGVWIANRYKDQKNIVWMLLGDIGTLNDEQLLVERALIKGLKSVDQESVHFSAESHSGENAADNIHVGNEMTLNGVYTWELKDPVPHMGRRGYSHTPTMPAFLLEEPYDEEGPDGNNYNPNATQPVRRFQWWGWLSTTGGCISGNGYVWQFVDPIWQQHLDTQGAKDMTRLNRFIRSIEWWKLVPSGLDGMENLVVFPDNPDTTASYVASSAARDGSLLVAYIPPAFNSPTVTIQLGVLTEKAYGYWFDPTHGDYISIKGSPFPNKGTHTFATPGKNSRQENDWLLLLTVDRREN